MFEESGVDCINLGATNLCGNSLNNSETDVWHVQSNMCVENESSSRHKTSFEM